MTVFVTHLEPEHMHVYKEYNSILKSQSFHFRKIYCVLLGLAIAAKKPYNHYKLSVLNTVSHTATHAVIFQFYTLSTTCNLTHNHISSRSSGKGTMLFYVDI